MTAITVRPPLKVQASRAAGWIAQGFAALLAHVQSGKAERAERRRQAERAFEAAAVREYAQRFAQHDPRFAADLLAAADRHEITQ